MVIGSGNATIMPIGTTAAHTASSVAALNAQIRQAKSQLDDWTTCVSSKTTKGQSEIQRLSAEISGAKQQEQHLEASRGSLDVWA
jgi:predicted  nucleic acid-binding Zn-ribbon protein